MAKPILLVTVPAYLSTEKTLEIKLGFKDQLPDWHILVHPASSHLTSLTFSVLSEYTAIHIEPIELEKLKELCV